MVIKVQLEGKYLHANEQVADDEDQHQQGDVRDIIEGLHDNSQKFLKVFPKLGQLKDSNETKNSQGSQRS